MIHRILISTYWRTRNKRAATARPERIWDFAVIPYEIDSNFSGVSAHTKWSESENKKNESENKQIPYEIDSNFSGVSASLVP